MSIILEYSFFILFLILLNFIMIKKGIFLDMPVSNTHKNKIFFSKKVPKSLGFILMIFIFYKLNLQIYEKILIFLIFFLGIQSDINKLSSPKLRIIIQFLIVLFFLLVSKEYINSTRIPFIDNFLNNEIFKILLTLLCIIIVINGSNFIDGLNTFCLGYYLGLFICLNLLLLNNYDFVYLKNEIFYLILLIFILYLFNLFGLSFLGDSGSYLLGFVASIFLLKYHNLSPQVSPWFIANLLWYPSFEILFSIIRRFRKEYDPLLPDNYHLHQIIFLFIQKKLKYKNNLLNPLTANLINIYNYFVFFFSSIYFSNTKALISIFLFSCFIYIMAYLLFLSRLKKK